MPQLNWNQEGQGNYNQQTQNIVKNTKINWNVFAYLEHVSYHQGSSGFCIYNLIAQTTNI
ncbi:unnamed protein product [Paramecium octaurelia]|uniref:Uncharacterized protein n=1 Tax=Paramecium octaurelia TaxID=43137 RepID=A0A8S1UXP4_PAROT|nr:unnamed protein product [Paramecium octaurelia]